MFKKYIFIASILICGTNAFAADSNRCQKEKPLPGDALPNETVVAQVAQVILSGIYGKEVIEKEMPFSIILHDGIWVVNGVLDDSAGDVVGGVVTMEISKNNGRILKIIHTR
jgi:hypothetical protein